LEPEGKNVDIQKRAIGMAILDYTAADYVRDFVILDTFHSRKYNVKKITNDILEQITSEATKRQMDAIMNGIGWIDIADPSGLIAEFGEHATRIARLPEKMRNYGLLNNNFSGKEKAKEALLSVIPMLKSERESILQSIDDNNKQLGSLEALEEKMNELNRRLGLEKDRSRPKKDPSELEVNALYQEIRKALS
jgi:hypothetical protein